MPKRTSQSRTSPIMEPLRSRQAKLGRDSSTQHRLSTEDTVHPPCPPKLKSSSIHSNNRISFKLVSLVTRFEALDALSLPFRLPSLQPAPLQVKPQVQKRRGGTLTGHFRRLSMIFSPPSRSDVNKEDPFFSGDDLVSGRDNLFSSSHARKFDPLVNRTNSKRLRSTNSLNIAGSLRIKGAMSKQNTPKSSITAPYVTNESPSRSKSSIREMIKLYDGAASDGVLTKAKPSTIGSQTPNTPTPISRHKASENRYHPSPSTGNSRLKAQQHSSKRLDSPTRCQISSKQSLRLESPQVSKGSIGQSSPSKSSVNSMHISPLTFDRARQQSNTGNPRGFGSPNRGRTDKNVNQCLQNSCNGKTSDQRQMDRGRSLVRKDMPAKYDRKQISERIENLYRVKSVERNQESRVTQGSKMPFTTTGKDSRDTGHPPAYSDFGKYLRKRSSKVAAMTKLFDNGSPPRPSVIVVSTPTPRRQKPQKPQKPVFSASSPFVEKETTPNSEVRPPPNPPLMPPMTKRKSTISPKTIQEPWTGNSKTSSIAKLKTDQGRQHTLLQKKPSQPKGRSINEKVQLFESVKDGNDSVLSRKRNVFARKLSRSLKSLFEHPSRRSENEKSDGHARALDGKELQNIIDEVQDAHKTIKSGKRMGTLVGRWNSIQPPQIGNGCDGALSEKGFGSPSAPEVREMVVKEAECGLKEPKPVRVAEVKRMMLICKERFGDMMDKEKSTR